MLYDPPGNSSYSKGIDHSILDCIKKDIAHYHNHGNYLCGDCNARVYTKPDFIVIDYNGYIHLHSNYIVDQQILNLHNMDSKLDNQDRDLLDLCISNHLKILSGGTFRNKICNYACCTFNGRSTVDYVLK